MSARSINVPRALSSVGWPLLFGAVFLALWEAIVQVFDLKPYFLPAPSAIAEAFADNLGVIWDATRHSGTNALVGLIAGTVLGVAMSFLLVRFRLLTEIVTPLAVALNAIPIVVLVTVFLNMYGSTSEIPRRLMVTLIVFFIVLVNVAKGLEQVHPTHLELLRSYAASPTAVLRKARIPNAVPYLFTALKIAAPASVITAFVAEYFGGRDVGLGRRIPSNFANSRNAVAWAYVLGACLLGLTFYLVSIAMESTTRHRRGAAPGGGA
jgi:NitT/TauT family transport system permease protein